MNTPKVGRSKRAKQAQEIQFHREDWRDSHPAINVKYRGDAPSEYAWDATVEQFWFHATTIAHEHGYSGVFSEGRSSGWLVPFYQYAGNKLQKFSQWPGQGPDYGYPTYPDVNDSKERKRFIRFQKDILELLDSVPQMLADNAKEEN